jgi:hypothetical protein
MLRMGWGTNPVNVQRASRTRGSEVTPAGRKETKLQQILLNGNNIALVSDGHRSAYALTRTTS